VKYELHRWLTQGNHLYKSHCRLLLPWLRMLCWFFLKSWVEKLLACGWGFEPTTLDLSSQSGGYDLSAMATFHPFYLRNHLRVQIKKLHSTQIGIWFEEKICDSVLSCFEFFQFNVENFNKFNNQNILSQKINLSHWNFFVFGP